MSRPPQLYNVNAYTCKTTFSYACPRDEFRLQANISNNTLRPRENSLHFADDTFQCIFLNENV